MPDLLKGAKVSLYEHENEGRNSVTLNNHDGVKNQAVRQNFYGPVSFGNDGEPKPGLGNNMSRRNP
ncbi:hypothetical protein BDV36DRAFT_249832 [Aspergillus pseudocaelatus]|uniref:Uncharacterized protein n=1 Tax=Aspergillus pseudocaelatus TaxID=1825620 RepID=A0ABQ6WTW2_9EURO|nr:hypothetical protein BDV36DRAFT_249832 [Aspergillus pseudocaelatus]